MTHTTNDPRGGARTWQVRVLGSWHLETQGREIKVPPREQRLVALLALVGARRRSVLAGMLWPDSNEARASANLRTAAVELRRRAPGLLDAEQETLQLAGRVSTDVAMLRDRLRAPRQEVAPAAEAGYLLGVEELLPGWYDEWVVTERDRLRQGVLDRISTVVRRQMEDDPADALPLARAAAELDPMRESVHRALATIHLLEGDRVAAWQVYEDFHRRSVREFGVAPSAKFEELVEPMRAERRARRTTGGPVPMSGARTAMVSGAGVRRLR